MNQQQRLSRLEGLGVFQQPTEHQPYDLGLLTRFQRDRLDVLHNLYDASQPRLSDRYRAFSLAELEELHDLAVIVHGEEIDNES